MSLKFHWPSSILLIQSSDLNSAEPTKLQDLFNIHGMDLEYALLKNIDILLYIYFSDCQGSLIMNFGGITSAVCLIAQILYEKNAIFLV